MIPTSVYNPDIGVYPISGIPDIGGYPKSGPSLPDIGYIPISGTLKNIPDIVYNIMYDFVCAYPYVYVYLCMYLHV